MSRAVALPQVGGDEQLARFVLHSTHVRQDNTLRADPFIPHPYPDLSVTRHLSLNDLEIRDRGEMVARQTGKSLKGRADTAAQIYLGQRLRVVADPTPENPQHANVTGWPSGKPAQKILALEIAAQSTFIPVQPSTQQ